MTPKFTTTLGANYTHRIENVGTLDVHADYSYQSRIYYAPLSVADPASHPFESIGGYGLLNGTISLELDDPQVTIGIWAKNRTNKQYLTSIVDFVGAGLGATTAFVGDPRTYGATIGISF